MRGRIRVFFVFGDDEFPFMLRGGEVRLWDVGGGMGNQLRMISTTG
jgi:hypothetical protein